MVSGASTHSGAGHRPLDEGCAELALAVQSDAVRLPFSESSFDAAFILDVLEHIDEDETVLREIRRVLRPGGSLLITVPAFMFLYGRQDRGCQEIN